MYVTVGNTVTDHNTSIKGVPIVAEAQIDVSTLLFHSHSHMIAVNKLFSVRV